MVAGEQSSRTLRRFHPTGKGSPCPLLRRGQAQERESALYTLDVVDENQVWQETHTFCPLLSPTFKTFPARYRQTDLSEQSRPYLTNRVSALLSWLGESASSSVPYKTPSYFCPSTLN